MKANKEWARFSIDNGCTFMRVYELPDGDFPKCGVSWDAIVALMDDDTREEVHRAIAPCSEMEFLKEYLKRATEDLIIG